MDCIYLDNNASTPVLPAVWEAMRPHATDDAANPASTHQPGRRARQALEDAREQTAALLGAHGDEVVFTSGATEANNLAIFGLAGTPPGHLITSPIEHPCVSEPLQRLADNGFSLDRLPVDKSGTVQADALGHLLRPESRLVTVMLANHETGAIQPIKALTAKVAGGPPCHCDAAAAAGKIPVHFHDLDVATLTLSAHKFHGPKGIGALLVRRQTPLRPQLLGGHQQQGRRPGTESVMLAVGMAAALELAIREMQVRTEHVKKLRHGFLTALRSLAAPVLVNGPVEGGVPHTLNVSFPGCQADVLLMNLDLAGVACSTGSACSSGSLLPSPVIRALGVPEDVLHSAMRFSFSALLGETEVTEAARRIGRVVTRLRNTSASEEPAKALL
jgi:cysteine desulfurase